MSIDKILNKFENTNKHEKIRGFIIIKENDKIIDTVENMITLTGRRAILNKYFKDGTKLPEYMFIDTNADITSDESQTIISNNAKFSTTKIQDTTTNSSDVFDMHITENDCYCLFKKTFKFEPTVDEIKINSIGLSFNNSTKGTGSYSNIFSRAVINPKTFSGNNEYTIEYYFYF